ncbi:MAG: cupin domain-containing protein [Chloroflexi bacterium]|nr:cupin domain-containing protein [Chloroflexota bacterium]MBI4504780.1 cupin domain-containing protein [Chloroflexota bacterium]
MQIMRSGKLESRPAPAARFGGTVRHERLVDPQPPTGLRMSRVLFEPGGRTNWHSHPGGQALHVIVGRGRVAEWGQSPAEILAGDTVFIAPGVKHWHGAAPTSAMMHLAISAGEGDTEWMEPVSEEDYVRDPA